MADKERIIDRIVKLFRLGTADRNNSEEEAASAVTKARVLMAEHDISMYEIEAKAGTSAAKKIEFEINEHQAYVRKIRDLALYDHAVAQAVGVLTSTRPLLHHSRTYEGHWTKLVFVGTSTDAAVAGELFIILLQTVRRLARVAYGGGNTWGIRHTSFAVGCAQRLHARAKDAVRTMTPVQQECTALIVRGKDAAIDQYFSSRTIGKGKARRTAMDGAAFTHGWHKGADVSLGTGGLKAGVE